MELGALVQYLIKLLPLHFMLYGGILLGSVTYLNDYSVRQRHTKLLKSLRLQSETFACVEAFGHLSDASLFRLGFTWERAELYLTQDSVYYFGYRKLMGRHRIYHRMAQLGLPQALVSTPLIKRGYYVIEASTFASGVWEIRYQRLPPGRSFSSYTMLLSDLSLEASAMIREFHQRIAL